MNTEARIKLLEHEVRKAFTTVEGNVYYSQFIPWQMTDYIDGLCHLSILLGAMTKYGKAPLDLHELTSQWIIQLDMLGVFVRNVSPVKPNPSWTEHKGVWVKAKPQSFAGPAALHWAAPNTAWKNGRPTVTAWTMVLTAPLFGYLVKPISGLRQHINSVFLAHLLLGKKPPRSMSWLAEWNPFYSYIYGRKCEVTWPTNRRTSAGYEEEKNLPQALAFRKPGSWPVKQWPYKNYIRSGAPVNRYYTPVCELACLYLQETL